MLLPRAPSLRCKMFNWRVSDQSQNQCWQRPQCESTRRWNNYSRLHSKHDSSDNTTITRDKCRHLGEENTLFFLNSLNFLSPRDSLNSMKIFWCFVVHTVCPFLDDEWSNYVSMFYLFFISYPLMISRLISYNKYRIHFKILISESTYL